MTVALDRPAGGGLLARIGIDRTSWLSRLLRDPAGIVGIAIISVVILLALFPSFLAPYSPHDNAGGRFSPISWSHPMGTDNLGRDVLSRVIYGARTSMTVGAAALVFAILGGASIGLVSGYAGGKIDLVSQRVIDAWQAFPTLILAMAVVALLGPGLDKAVIAIGITLVPGVVRVVRGSTLAERNLAYIEAATVLGASPGRIVLRHILPNVIAPILVLGSVYLGAGILLEATLGFLSLGAQPPTISWGTMLSRTGLRFLQNAPNLAIFPGLAIAMTVFGLSMLGDALRDALDPRLRQR